ncbi:MAG: biotin-dependent carboxyltransferase family protein [Haliscomenobacter sp.]|nr:biotin-dependent carboxyltransferase family protein [Haliscomenobacter sp.]
MAEPIFLHFIKPGLQTTVQDGGRPGFQAYGVPVSGALDPESARAANELVGNDPGGPVLEIPLLGPEIRFEGAAQIALTGADLDARLDGAPAPRYATLRVREGQTLAFGKPVHGCRAYLAVGGTWMVRSWLHSASATPFATEALTPDSLLRKGSRLAIQPNAWVEPQAWPEELLPHWSGSPRIQVVPGPEFERFPPLAIAHFFGRPHRIAPQSNRMGYRFQDPLPGIPSPSLTEIISSGIVPGTIQITPSGHPILLLADAQTTGGYARIAVAPAFELGRLAQCKPGDGVWFQVAG